jgi:hypothetical protein
VQAHWLRRPGADKKGKRMMSMATKSRQSRHGLQRCEFDGQLEKEKRAERRMVAQIE